MADDGHVGNAYRCLLKCLLKNKDLKNAEAGEDAACSIDRYRHGSTRVKART